MPHDIVPFQNERAAELRDKVARLDGISPVLDAPQLVHGWLPDGAFSVFYGPSNSGKSFFALDLAMHVAAGQPWRERRVAQGGVLYLAAEGGAGIRNRIAALKIERPELCDNENFYLLPTSVDLSTEADAAALAQLLPSQTLKLIVIDTLARAFGGGDENSSRDMGLFVRNVDRLRALTGAHVLAIHHSGKDAVKGARGSSALRAAADTEISISEAREVAVAKQRDLEILPPIFFDLRRVELGQDAYGETVSSAIVEPADKPKLKPNRKPLRGKPEVAMAALDEALREHGELKNSPDFPAHRKVVRTDLFCAACERREITKGKSESALRMAFSRITEKLQDADLIRIYDDYVWRVYEE